MKSTICGLFLLLNITGVFASELTIENIRAVNRDGVLETPISVIFDLKWNNSWNNAKNHDAVWVFMKFNGYWNNQVKLSPSGHSILKNRTNASDPEIRISEDRLGFYIVPPSNYRGTIDVKLQMVMDTTERTINWEKLKGMKVHGIEMVYIPNGSFYVGTPDAQGTTRAALYESDESGHMANPYHITSEEQIKVGPNSGALYYWSENTLYNGDQTGPIPMDFPKGFEAFYIMKYELTQGQYVDFLNSIPDNWTFIRSPIGGRKYYEKRGGIYFEGKYKAKSYNRPMNYISFTDGLAYSDWACLRPITELEYEKAARGPGKPIDAEFVWGTQSYNNLERYVTEDFELKFENGFDESQLDDSKRDVFGASYYWVMDLSGSLWEKVITIGNPRGRAFKGSHGDGILDFGSATNEDWPDNDNEQGGFGYRGGGGTMRQAPLILILILILQSLTDIMELGLEVPGIFHTDIELVEQLCLSSDGIKYF